MNDKSKYLDDYVTMIGSILVDFQFIEESIRMYISNAFKYIVTQLSGEIPFLYDYKDIEKDALGKLINKFEKLNDNKRLIAELNDLKKYRNDCAHRGFLLTGEQVHDEKYLKSDLKKLEKIKERTANCLSELHKEVLKIELLN